MTEKSMMIYHSKWQEKDSFRLLPVTKDCPFNEVIYNPNDKILAIISKDQKDKPQLLPKLNDRGEFIRNKAGAHTPYQEERRIMPVYYEYYIEEMADIIEFINIFAINSSHPAFVTLEKEHFSKESKEEKKA
jgi:hypothetical protein